MMLCEAVEMYLDCVEGWVTAVEVLVHEVHAQARRNHCYEANQEDANDCGCWKVSYCVRDQCFVAVLLFFRRLMLRFRAGAIGNTRTNRSVRMLMAAIV